MNGWLDDTRGLAVTRGVGAALGVPEVYAWEVFAEAGIEDYLRQEAIIPLAVEEVRKLPHGAALVVV